jgi:hypothetical protein
MEKTTLHETKKIMNVRIKVQNLCCYILHVNGLLLYDPVLSKCTLNQGVCLQDFNFYGTVNVENYQAVCCTWGSCNKTMHLSTQHSR